MDDPAISAFIFATFVLAGFVKGVIGLGLPTIAYGPPRRRDDAGAGRCAAGGAVVRHQCLAGAWVRGRRRCCDGPGRCCSARASERGASVSGPGLRSSRPTTGCAPRSRLGIGLALYAALGLSSLAVLGAGTAGAMAVAVDRRDHRPRDRGDGRLHDPADPYLQALGLQKDDLVLAMGLSFTVSTLLLAVVLVADGALQFSVAGVSLLALVPALTGMLLGQWVRGRVAPRIPSASASSRARSSWAGTWSCAHSFDQTTLRRACGKLSVTDEFDHGRTIPITGN